MTNDVAEIRKMMEADRKMRAKVEATENAEKAEEASEHKDDVGVEDKNGYKSAVQSEDDGLKWMIITLILILIPIAIVLIFIN